MGFQVMKNVTEGHRDDIDFTDNLDQNKFRQKKEQ